MLLREPLWYKDAVLYELHVRAFYDSVGDGTGEFRGLAQKLDYLQDLGVTAIWLLPFYPSPLRDDGYDIADYTSIHPSYGDLEGFQEFLDAAHVRGLRVITELVINHTSDQHPWFQRARRAPPGSNDRDFYVWSDTPEKYSRARIIFKDFETSNWTWDKVAKAYYWHRFYSHQPDLNFDNPAVWEAIFPVVDFWFGLGVDGLRLDAVPYLFEREGTHCENLPETHEFLKALRRHVDEKFPDRMLLAEANQWPEDSVAYFGKGDECHMAFHFPVMPRLFMAMHMEDRLPIVDIIEQTPEIPENCQWALFLRNHDELTLEMVTDEERDFMYRAYASDPRARINLGIRHRLAPLLGNNRRRIELMNGLLFSLPGTPVIYYGDEIGMGDNIYLGDRNGVRTPMQWSADRNAGFSRANPQKLYLPIIIDPEYHYEAVNVEAQQNNLNSLLWWTKRLIGLRRRHKSFSRGKLEFLRPLNRHVLAFLRSHESETVLVVANLSRFVQYAELDLAAFDGITPRELFGGSTMPPISNQPYSIMLGPHSFYWFSLTRDPTPVAYIERPFEQMGELYLQTDWEQAASDPNWEQIEPLLRDHFTTMPIVQESGRSLRRLTIRDNFVVKMKDQSVQLLIVDLEIPSVSTETTWIALAVVDDPTIVDRNAHAIVGRLTGKREGWLCDAMFLPEFNETLLEIVANRRRVRSQGLSELKGVVDPLASKSLLEQPLQGTYRPVITSQHLVGVVAADRFVLKPLVRLEVTNQPELDLGRWLTQKKGFAHSSQWAGSLEYRIRSDQPMTLVNLLQYVPNEGDAWQFTLDELSVFFDRVLALSENERNPPEFDTSRVLEPEQILTPSVHETFGGYLDVVRQLANRLADLHKVIASEVEDAAFSPEEFSPQYQRSLYQSMRNLCTRVFYEVKQAEASVPMEHRGDFDHLLREEPHLMNRFHRLIERRYVAWRLRIHANCHLGQLLRSGKEFVFVDFDGGPQSLGERRIKRSPLRDVAGMLHSFDYAALAALRGANSRRGRSVGLVRGEDLDQLHRWNRFWRRLVHNLFIDTYQKAVIDNPYLSLPEADFDELLDAFMLERGLHELRRTVREGSPAIGVAIETLERYLRDPHDTLATEATS